MHLCLAFIVIYKFFAIDLTVHYVLDVCVCSGASDFVIQ